MSFLKNFLVKLAAKKAAKVLKLEDGPMDESKKWYKSKGVLTGIVTVLFGTYEAVKLSLAPQMGWTLPDIPPLVYTVLGALGIYSRVVASEKVG
jgi:hypothetical protein